MMNRLLIKKKRLEHGYSQEDLAIRVGYATKGTISRIESGQLKDIPISKAIRLSKILEIEIQDLVKGGYHV
jgi:transcriptional regulator with XRE-family HTH domain